MCRAKEALPPDSVICQPWVAEAVEAEANMEVMVEAVAADEANQAEVIKAEAIKAEVIKAVEMVMAVAVAEVVLLVTTIGQKMALPS